MKIHQDKVIELIEHLRGSCLSIDQGVSDIFGEDVDWMIDFPEEVIQDIDEAIFNCASCGWWYEISDMRDDESGDQICCNCYYEEHEEEE